MKKPLIEIEGNAKDGFTITSPIIPELITQGDTVEEAFANLIPAIQAVIENYGKDKPNPKKFPNNI